MKFLSTSRLITASIILFSTLTIYSCKKEGTGAPKSTTSEADATMYSQETSQADASFDDLDAISQVAGEEDDLASTEGNNGRYFPTWKTLRSIIGDCGTITCEPMDSTYPKTITVDFGDSCVGLDGKVRSGKIILNLTAPRRKAGSVSTLTLENFYLNHVRLEGTKVVTNNSTSTEIKYNVAISGGKVTFPNGHGYSFEAQKERIQIGGTGTKSILDNVFQITGSANIIFNNGTVVALNVVDPLIKSVICPWRSNGTVKVVVNNNFTLKMDYGFPSNGGCDNKALLTWNNGNSQRVVILP